MLSGVSFNLSIKSGLDKKNLEYFFLRQKSSNGMTDYTSDWMCNTYLDWHRIGRIKAQLSSNEKENFEKISTRIGNYIIFPKGAFIPPNVEYNSQTKDKPWGINRARGLDKKICDRCEFFLLDDLVDSDYSKVKFFLYFDSFDSSLALPQSVTEYQTYINAVTEFIEARNCRISEYDAKQLTHVSPYRS